MATGRRKTTRAKLDRERKLVERRAVKEAKRQTRKDASAQLRTSEHDGLPEDS